MKRGLIIRWRNGQTWTHVHFYPVCITGPVIPLTNGTRVNRKSHFAALFGYLPDGR
jgi:hypothetical protein